MILVGYFLALSLTAVSTNSSTCIAVRQGLLGRTRVLGGSIGIAISFTILHTSIRSNLQDAFLPAQLNAINCSPLAIASLSPGQLLLARNAYGLAFDTIMYACIGLSAASCIVALFIYEKDPVSVEKKLREASHSPKS